MNNSVGPMTNPVRIISGFDTDVNCSNCSVIMLENSSLKLPGYEISNYSPFVWKGKKGALQPVSKYKLGSPPPTHTHHKTRTEKRSRGRFVAQTEAKLAMRCGAVQK